MAEELRKDLEDEFTLSELLRIARKRGLKKDLATKGQIVDWLVENGLTRREYELRYNPYIHLKLRICRFFGIKKGWRVMDIGCGSCGTSVAAASLVGSKGCVLAVDYSEEEMARCTSFLSKVGFEDIVETRLATVGDLEFDDDSFDMILLLYSPQFLGYLDELEEVLLKIKNWTSRIGIADHIPVPGGFHESIYVLLNWLTNDAGRINAARKKTARLFHPEEIKNALRKTGWKTIKERQFRVSKKNSFPEWAMRNNIKRLSMQIENLEDPFDKEILFSRLRTIETLTDHGTMPKPTSMTALVAEKVKNLRFDNC